MRYRIVMAFALVLCGVGSLQAQQRVSNQPPLTRASLEPTSTSNAAATAFRAAMFESQNVNPPAAIEHINAALSADPQFGLALAYKAILSTQLTPAERERSVQSALATMGNASIPEVMLALYWREVAGGRGPAAVPLLKSVVEMVPGDAAIAYILLGTQNAGKTTAEQAQNLRTFLLAFPQHAAAQNNAAYAYWNSGDASGALTAVQAYERLAPNHFNSHDSHADILLLERRPREAMAHVQRELELAPGDAGALQKLAVINLMLGDIATARTGLTTGLAAETAAADRAVYQYWLAVTHIYGRDGRAALRQLAQIATDAGEAKLAPAAVATAHLRAGVVEAYLGKAKAVAGHFEAVEKAVPEATAGHHMWEAIALSRIGKAPEARGSLAQYTAMPAQNAALVPTLQALLALDAGDVAGATAALAKSNERDLLTRAVRAELLMRKGERQASIALRDEVLASSVKIAGNPPVDFLAVVGRMRAQQIR